MPGNLLIAQSGGTTSVINATLYGVIKEAMLHNEIENIYGSLGGAEGILNERIVDLRSMPEKELEDLKYIPGMLLGGSRYPFTDKDYRYMVDKMIRYNIKYVLYNGGNGSMLTCDKIYQYSKDSGINVIGLPKTADNDICEVDHTPGYGSAARYMISHIRDNLLIKNPYPLVYILTVPGAQAGWISASTILAREKPGDPPQLIYTSQRPFIMQRFLMDLDKLFKKGIYNIGVVVQDELTDENGKYVMWSDNVTDLDLSAYLTRMVMNLKHVPCLFEDASNVGRISSALQSAVDRDEAEECGRQGVRAVLNGKSGYMIGLKRVCDDPYQIEYNLVPLDKVAGLNRSLPDKYINSEGNGITDDFIQYVRPLIGEPFHKVVRNEDLNRLKPIGV